MFIIFIVWDKSSLTLITVSIGYQCIMIFFFFFTARRTNTHLKFDYIFPNTDVSCGYVIRYFFHTNIHLGKESNKLISMNGSIFNFENIDIIEEREYIISLTKSVLMVVGDMYFGSSELQEFLNIYPGVVI